ncbi:tetratricopeptide repeat protein [Flavobacterium luteum]|uniref:Tetratricopeptide repeat protein n=1 Tax=Flavobacterium luteum TaxID=2026654 RepID=A0A7J5AA13_9FLAO|nr:tetratricopeptide repeat protein [Flavobacterium luteum]KAB1154390.1 tetratricopeptide repeat protein [Flavobacterium luteum]
MKNILTYILLTTILLFGKSQISYGQTTINMKKEGGVYSIPCSVNGIGLKFIFDTGASNVSISLTEANFLFKNGYLTKKDIIGSANFQDATGNVSVGTIINIRKLEFSGIILNNVEAQVVHELNAPLLLGQSAMAKLGKFQFDPNSGALTLLDNSIKIIDSGTKEGRAYCDSGNSKQELEDYNGAMTDYNKAIDINPNFFRCYWLRGVLKSVMGDNNGAIIDFTKSIKLNPDFKMAYVNRGWSKADLEDFKGSIIDFTKAIQVWDGKDDLAIIYFSRGCSKKELKDEIGAIADFNKAIELDPNDFQAYGNRGHSKMILKDYKGAIADFDKLIEIHPEDGLAFYNRGQAKMALGQKDNACMDWRKAGELGYENVFEDIKEYCN